MEVKFGRHQFFYYLDLFSDHMMAFEHGGVVYDIYRRFHFLVKRPVNISDNLTSTHQKFLSKIFPADPFFYYAKFSK